MKEGDGSGRKVIVNYGEDDIVKRQIDKTLYRDIMWALLSVFFATVMLRIGTKSTFLTATGIFMILVRCPQRHVQALPSPYMACIAFTSVVLSCAAPLPRSAALCPLQTRPCRMGALPLAAAPRCGITCMLAALL
jgi:hypothetical protein